MAFAGSLYLCDRLAVPNVVGIEVPVAGPSIGSGVLLLPQGAVLEHLDYTLITDCGRVRDIFVIVQHGEGDQKRVVEFVTAAVLRDAFRGFLESHPRELPAINQGQRFSELALADQMIQEGRQAIEAVHKAIAELRELASQIGLQGGLRQPHDS